MYRAIPARFPLKGRTLLLTAFFWTGFLSGCNTGNPPMAPAHPMNLQVSLAGLDRVRASFLGSAQNEILWRLDSGATFFAGTVGPFSSGGASGAYGFQIDTVPSQTATLSVQMNDYPSGQALAVGAAIVSPLGGNIFVDMGSVSRMCYKFDSTSTLYGYYMSYGFAKNTLQGGVTTPSPNFDISSTFITGGFMFQNCSTLVTNNIAYLGNGNLVDFDYVPALPSFYNNSATAKGAAALPVTALQVGDVFCVKLGTILGAHAWVQVTDPGSMSLRGPNFVFRVNSSLPYYAYERTPGDLFTAGHCDLLCPGMVGHYNTTVPSNDYAQTRMYFTPVTVFSAVTLTGMAFEQTGSASPSGPVTFQMGLYTDLAGKPSSLIASTSVGSTTTPGMAAAPFASYVTMASPATFWLGIHTEEINHDATTFMNNAFYDLPSNTYGNLPSPLPAASVTLQPSTYPVNLKAVYCP